MICTDESWFMVRNTEKVTGFIGSSGHGALPVPMQDEEIIPILKMCGMTIEKSCPYDEGDEVTITAGTFAGHDGKVGSIDYEKGEQRYDKRRNQELPSPPRAHAARR